MDRAEKIVIFTGVLMMSFFLSCLIYAARYLDITIPFCNDNVTPFTVGKVIEKGNNRFEVHLVAKMWSFDPPEIRLPRGADVDLYVSSLDVNHGVHIAGTNVNLMAVPGAVNGTRVRFKELGNYRFLCHEYCGAGHQGMMGQFTIVDGPYQEPVAKAGAGIGPENGEALFTSKGCAACHSRDGNASVGPTLKNVWGRKEELEGGGHVIVDESYIRESIKNPSAKIVKGFQPLMPVLTVTDDEIEKLISYIKKL